MTVENHVFDGPQDAADEINSTVLIEVLVLDGDGGLLHGFGYLGDGDDGAIFGDEDVVEQFAIAVEDFGGLGNGTIGQVSRRGKVFKDEDQGQKAEDQKDGRGGKGKSERTRAGEMDGDQPLIGFLRKLTSKRTDSGEHRIV